MFQKPTTFLVSYMAIASKLYDLFDLAVHDYDLCPRLVISISHAAKLYCVNRRLDCHLQQWA